MKNCWHHLVSPHGEYEIFSTSDERNWNDANGHYWGFGDREGQIEVGESGERICKFPMNSNATDPWHGYPVSPAQTGDRDAPPDELISRWLIDNAITRVFARRIQRRKI